MHTSHAYTHPRRCTLAQFSESEKKCASHTSMLGLVPGASHAGLRSQRQPKRTVTTRPEKPQRDCRGARRVDVAATKSRPDIQAVGRA